MQILINTCSYQLTERLMSFVDYYFEKHHMSNYNLWLKEYRNSKFTNTIAHRLHTQMISVYQIIQALKEMTRWMQEMISEYEYEIHNKTSDCMLDMIILYINDINMYDMMLKQLALKCKNDNEFKQLELYFTNGGGREGDQYNKEHFNEIFNNYMEHGTRCRTAPAPLYCV